MQVKRLIEVYHDVFGEGWDKTNVSDDRVRGDRTGW